MRKITWMLSGLISLVAVPSLAADGTGLATNGEPWARWQGRLSFGTSPPPWHAGLADPDSQAVRLNRMSLMGDYYVTSSLIGAGSVGGLRATGGVILGPRVQLWAGQVGASGSGFNIGSRPFGPSAMPYTNDPGGDTVALPYLGLGYTGLSVHSGWRFSADLGLVAQSPGNASRLGRALGGGQSLDDAVRDLRISPLLQVGASYAF
ncbi:MAG: hypothetical protein H7337_02155 [Rhizobacter sp.]|nr:hypothetical protein [Rhizobacter sp.]